MFGTVLKKIILVGILIFLPFTGGVFANSNNSLQETVNDYILQVYKLQSNKILKDLGTSLEKVANTPGAKIKAYENIKDTLRARKTEVLENTAMGENSKKLLITYLDFLISEIHKQQKSLE